MGSRAPHGPRLPLPAVSTTARCQEGHTRSSNSAGWSSAVVGNAATSASTDWAVVHIVSQKPCPTHSARLPGEESWGKVWSLPQALFAHTHTHPHGRKHAHIHANTADMCALCHMIGADGHGKCSIMRSCLWLTSVQPTQPWRENSAHRACFSARRARMLVASSSGGSGGMGISASSLARGSNSQNNRPTYKQQKSLQILDRQSGAELAALTD